ncbi:hypothetical protein [Companilactobacillus sp.]|uniref:hypothetical protein n=1 Tax=Companilactobacillus sp. TaxID=2767905 RepID=UPI002608C1A5|nr:hypothetical protein [Companilactobacillus sp.]
MRKIYAAIVLIISLCALAVVTGFTAKTTQTKAQNEIVNTVKVASTKTTKTGSKNLIKYQLDVNAPILTITSPQFKNIDVEALKKEIGKDHVGVDSEHQKLHLNMKDNIDQDGKGSFSIVTTNDQKMIIDFSDINEEQLLMTLLNSDGKDALLDTEEKIDKPGVGADKPLSGETSEFNKKAPSKDPNTDVDGEADGDGDDDDDGVDEDANIHEDEDDPSKGWIRSENMMISPGHAVENSDGSKRVPVLYFGALNYALEGLSVKRSVAGRPLRTGLVAGVLGTPIGDGRMNNVTAANSAIIYVPKNGNINAVQTNNEKKRKNSFYTNTFGDGKLPPPPKIGTGLVSAGDKVYRGSQRNFVTTNIFDYYGKSSGDITKPKLFGPDAKNIGDYTGLVKKQTRLYYKTYEDPVTKETLTMQRLIFYQKIDGYQVRVKITQRFDANDGVIINHEFTNVGTRHMDNFTGYVFRDITFMRNHNKRSSDQSNVLRSLGNHKGIYAARADSDSKIEMQLAGYEDSPYAWSGRGTKSTFFEADKSDHFPWSYDGDIQKPNAFVGINDVGDKDTEPGFANSWIDEKIKYDSGVSMHTKNQSLAPNQTVTMSYATNLVPIPDNPELHIDDAKKKDEPAIMQPEDKDFKVSGKWMSAKSNLVKVKYLVRPAQDMVDSQKDKQELINNGISISKDYLRQKDDERQSLVPHRWSTAVKLDQLNTGINEFYAIAIDKVGRTSKIKRTYINLRNRYQEINPAITIKSPQEGTEEFLPHDPRIDHNFIDKIDISGKSYSPSGNFKIKYFVDDDDTAIDLASETDHGPTKLYDWELKDFSLKPYMNDSSPHHLTFKIYSK